MFKKKTMTKKEAVEIDITSLLDILVILLVFLLKSYNASDLTLDVVDNLNLPGSKSNQLGHTAVIVQVNKNKEIFVNNTIVEGANFNSDKIDALYGRLKEIQSEDQKSVNEQDNARTVASNTPRPVNIVLDQNHPYAIVQKVMHTAALAGHDQLKLIVQGMNND